MEQSPFGKIFVVDERGIRHLRFDQWQGDDQSTMNLTDPTATPMEYIRFASLLGTGFGISSPSRVLAVGLGGGGFVAAIHNAMQNASVEAVEIDPTVVRVAREYFGLGRLEMNPNSRLHMFIDDGNAYLERQGAAVYDSIFVDCYIAGVPSDQSDIPEHIISDSFFQVLRSRLRPLGLAAINVAENDNSAELAIVRRFSQAFYKLRLPSVRSNSDSCDGDSTHGPLSAPGRQRLGRVLTAMRAAEHSNGGDWPAKLLRMLVDEDETFAAESLVGWLGARLKPFYGTAFTLGWTSEEAAAGLADTDSATLCGYLTADDLERILLAASDAGQYVDSDPVTAGHHAERATGCLAFLTPESTNLLLVGQA